MKEDNKVLAPMPERSVLKPVVRPKDGPLRPMGPSQGKPRGRRFWADDVATMQRERATEIREPSFIESDAPIEGRTPGRAYMKYGVVIRRWYR